MTPTRTAPKPAAKTTTKAYSYRRFSTPEQLKGDSLRRQTQAARDYCARHGLALDESSYVDLGVSAYRGKNVETGMLAAFKEAVEKGAVPQGSFLLVESLDRISRNHALMALMALKEICEAGVAVVTLNDGREYTAQSLLSDPMSLMVAVLTFIRANEESVMKASRLKAAWGNKRTKAKTGERMTAMLPAWLTTEGKDCPTVVDKARAAVVRRVFQMKADGKGVGAIAQALNTDGTPTFDPPNKRRAKVWHPSYINRLLRNPAVVGTFVPTTTTYEGRKKVRTPTGERIKDYYPRVVPVPLFEKVQAQLSKKPSVLRGKPAMPLQNILGGLAVCAKCGSAMKRKSMVSTLADGTRKLYAYFVCTKAAYGKGCKYEAVPYDAVESHILDFRTFTRIPAPKKSESLEMHLNGAEEDVEACEKRRVKIRDLMLETGSRSLAADLQEADKALEEAKSARDVIAAKVESANGRLLQGRLDDLLAALRPEDPEAPMDKRKVNALLRSLLEKVELDTETCSGTLVWQHGGTSSFVWGFPKAD